MDKAQLAFLQLSLFLFCLFTRTVLFSLTSVFATRTCSVKRSHKHIPVRSEWSWSPGESSSSAISFSRAQGPEVLQSLRDELPGTEVYWLGRGIPKAYWAVDVKFPIVTISYTHGCKSVFQNILAHHSSFRIKIVAIQVTQFQISSHCFSLMALNYYWVVAWLK